MIYTFARANPSRLPLASSLVGSSEDQWLTVLLLLNIALQQYHLLMMANGLQLEIQCQQEKCHSITILAFGHAFHICTCVLRVLQYVWNANWYVNIVDAIMTHFLTCSACSHTQNIHTCDYIITAAVHVFHGQVTCMMSYQLEAAELHNMYN